MSDSRPVVRAGIGQLPALAGSLVAVTFGLMVFGASVRVNDAGLACPDWPLCFGEVIPTIDVGVAFEFGHRVLAGGVSLGFLGLVGLMWRRRQGVPSLAFRLAGLAAVVLAIQILLGGLTVWELLAEWTVTSHLLAGNTFCLLLFLIALTLREAGRPLVRDPVAWVQRGFAAGLALLVSLQVALGGLVSSSYAGLACGTWPGCNGAAWFPTFSGLVGLQVTHRLIAYVLLAVAVLAMATSRGRGRAGKATLLVGGLIVMQGGLGVMNVLWHLKAEITLAHTAGAAAIVLATTFLNWEVWRAPVRTPFLSTQSLPQPAREPS